MSECNSTECNSIECNSVECDSIESNSIENTDLTYYQINPDVILNRAREYYENDKERLRE